MPRIPVFDGLWSSTNVCVWDVAAAHLSFEDALRRDSENVGGEAFLVTGNGPAWTMNDSRAALKVTDLLSHPLQLGVFPTVTYTQSINPFLVLFPS